MPRIRPVSHLLLAGGLAVWLALAAAPPVHACSCMAPGPSGVELEKADAVFLGRVVAVETREREVREIRSFFSQHHVTFELEKVWKGCEEGETVTVTTASDGAACGYGFAEGESYLVYAYAVGRDAEGGTDAGDAPQLTTNLCTRNAPRERAGEDLEALGEPLRVVTGEPSGEVR